LFLQLLRVMDVPDRGRFPFSKTLNSGLKSQIPALTPLILAFGVTIPAFGIVKPKAGTAIPRLGFAIPKPGIVIPATEIGAL
jgi:hypothetical protein